MHKKQSLFRFMLFRGLPAFFAAASAVSVVFSFVIPGLAGRSPISNSHEWKKTIGAPDSFSFMVLGDVQNGLDSFEKFLRLAKERNCAFAVQSGDLVNRSRSSRYEIAEAVAGRSGFDRPIFVCRGNHDLDDGGDEFRERYGPERFNFRYGGSTFLIVDNPRGDMPDFDKIAASLPTQAGPILSSFVFSHCPFPTASDGRPLAGFLKSINTEVVFHGHKHEYSQFTRDNIRYVINGIGGDYSNDTDNFTAYATLVTVNGKDVKLEVIEIPQERSLFWLSAMLFYGDRWTVFVLGLVFGALFFWDAFIMRRRRRFHV